MTTLLERYFLHQNCVVEAYRLGKYDNFGNVVILTVVEVVEAYRLGKYDNVRDIPLQKFWTIGCRSLSFGFV